MSKKPLLLVGLLAAISACQPQLDKESTSTTESLDNAAKGSGEQATLNLCGQVYDGSSSLSRELSSYATKIEATDLQLKNEAIGVLMGAPQKLMKPFFGAGGRIIVTNDASTICARVQGTSSADDVVAAAGDHIACWRRTAAGQPPEIIINAKPGAVRHSLIRMLGYVFLEYFVERVSSEQAPSELNTLAWRQAISAFKDRREKLGSAFLGEVTNAQAHQRLAALKTKAPVPYANAILVEAIDSYACSAASRATFQKQFPATFAVFTDPQDAHAPVKQITDQ